MFCRLYWPHGGGVERHVEEVVRVLMGRGHEVVVVTEQYETSLELTEMYNGVLIHRIPFFALKSKQMLWTWMEQHDELIESADVVHIHDVFWWYVWSRWLFLSKPVFITFHGYEGNNPPTWKAVVHRKIAELLCNGSICVGAFMEKWYKASPTLITYGAVQPLEVELTSSNGTDALFWGRFDDDTGIETYIEAAQTGADLISKLILYGDGPLRTKIVNMKLKGVKILPWNREIISNIKSARYAFVSRYLSILEAMTVGRLVVAVYSNKIKKDYLLCHPQRDNMIIVGTASELVGRLRNLSPAREKKMIELAQKWARKQTWDRMVDQYEALWKK